MFPTLRDLIVCFRLRAACCRCQDVFLDSVRLEDNIAKNQALKENVFMMVVCVELRIPLFLVGKPGSSKSLAKAIVADAMQGDHASGPLFKTLKEVMMMMMVMMVMMMMMMMVVMMVMMI